MRSPCSLRSFLVVEVVRTVVLDVACGVPARIVSVVVSVVAVMYVAMGVAVVAEPIAAITPPPGLSQGVRVGHCQGGADQQAQQGDSGELKERRKA